MFYFKISLVYLEVLTMKNVHRNETENLIHCTKNFIER